MPSRSWLIVEPQARSASAVMLRSSASSRVVGGADGSVQQKPAAIR